MKTKKRLSTLVAALLTLSMLIAGAMPVFATAAEGDGEGAPATTESTFSVWDGTLSETLSGTGIETDPILIKSAADLALFASNVNNGKYANVYVYAKLDADVDLAGKPWMPIGMWGGGYFYGSFDGQGHTIKGLFIDESLVFTTSSGSTYTMLDKAGLFGLVKGPDPDNCVVIKNFNLDGEITTQKQRVEDGVVINEKGGIWKAGGVVCGATNLVLENIKCDVDITASYQYVLTYGNGTDQPPTALGTNNHTVGGLVAQATDQLNITDCVYSGNIYFNYDKKNDLAQNADKTAAFALNGIRIGGFVGTAAINSNKTPASSREIKNCSMVGAIDVTHHSNNSNTRVGGIAGAFMNGALIENTHMLGTFNFVQTSYGKGNCRAGYFAGGFGYAQNGATYTKSNITNSTCVMPITLPESLPNGAVGNTSNSDITGISTFTVQEAADDITFRAVQRDTTAITDTFDARLVSTLDSVNYSAVGYTVSVACGAENGTMALMPLTSVFTAIKHGDETLTAKQLSNDEDAYVAALEITDIPAVGTASIVVTPYLVGVDETTVIYGATTVLTFVDGVHFNTTTLQY